MCQEGQRGQQDAADAIGVSRRTIWRFENGKQTFSKSRKRKLLMIYGYSVSELNNFMLGNKEIVDLPAHAIRVKGDLNPKSYRNYKKEPTKEHRVLRILRLQAGLSQSEAAKKCGHKKSYINHIENGRVQLTKTKINHVVKSMGFKIQEFNLLMSQKVIRDEILIECKKLLNKIDNEKLIAVKALLENFS